MADISTVAVPIEWTAAERNENAIVEKRLLYDLPFALFYAPGTHLLFVLGEHEYRVDFMADGSTTFRTTTDLQM